MTIAMIFLKLQSLCRILKMLFCVKNQMTPADNWQDEENMESVYGLVIKQFTEQGRVQQ